MIISGLIGLHKYMYPSVIIGTRIVKEQVTMDLYLRQRGADPEKLPTASPEVGVVH